MPFLKKEYKKFGSKDYSDFVLAGDIGGTNTSLGIFGIKKSTQLLLSFHFKSNELKGLHHAINEVLDYAAKNHKLKISNACFAVAGVLSSDKKYAAITNVEWNASTEVLLKNTKLRKIRLINDFEAIGYGIPMLKKKNIAVIKKSGKIPKAPILIIGAGTGLGKTSLIYNESAKSYAAIPSEAGHSDFAAQTKLEAGLVDFIKIHKKIESVSYEQVLSGAGLANIYLFLRKSGKFGKTRYAKEIGNNPMPELISKYRKIDKTCRETFKIFKGIYAKFAKNFALDCLALGGVYIAGGIAPKNVEIFDTKFVEIFEQNYKMADVLRKMPVYLILNSNVGLLGAGFKAKSL